jgi:hypothetical protein
VAKQHDNHMVMKGASQGKPHQSGEAGAKKYSQMVVDASLWQLTKNNPSQGAKGRYPKHKN